MRVLGKIFDKILDSMDNDPTLKWNLLLKSNGVIKVKGNWASKEILLNGKPLEKTKIVNAIGINNEHFKISWGGNEKEDQLLAFSILFHFMSREDAEYYIDQFCEDFVSKLPKQDFDTEFGLLYWYNNMSGTYQRGKLSDRYGAADED